MLKADLSVDEAHEILIGYQKNPVAHVEVVQGVSSLEDYQKRILQAVRDHDRVVVAACHDVGKSFTLAKTILWFMSCFPPAKVITTAPTFNQVKRILWAEIRAGHRRSKIPLGGDMLLTEWKISDDWFAIGFTSKTTAGDGQGGSTFQGFHEGNILVVFDEATGVPHQIWVQAEGLLTSPGAKFVGIANPTQRNSEFFKCFTNPSYHKVYLSCFDSPNLKANKIRGIEDLQHELKILKSLSEKKAQERMKSYKIVHPKLLSLQWVMNSALKWGLSHPLFVSKVLGKFPDEDENVMIPLSVVEKAQLRYEDVEDKKRKVKLRSIGVDPARFGPDYTEICMIEDDVQTYRKAIAKSKTTEVSGEVINLLRDLERADNEIVVVDGTGLGGGVVDELEEAINSDDLPRSIRIREVHFAATMEKEDEKKHFANLKAKMFHRLADDMNTVLAIMPDAIYLEQLPTILYKFTSKGQLIIESKEDYKKRTGMSSPDASDALALANFGRYPEMDSGNFLANMINPREFNEDDITGPGDQW